MVLVITPEAATTETVEAISATLTEKGFEVRDTRSEVGTAGRGSRAGQWARRSLCAHQPAPL